MTKGQKIGRQSASGRFQAGDKSGIATRKTAGGTVVETIRTAGKSEKSDKVELRVSSREKHLLQEASRQLHQSLSAFVLASSIERAKSLLAEQTSFILTDEQWDSFVQALDQPAEPKPRLAALLKEPGYGE